MIADTKPPEASHPAEMDVAASPSLTSCSASTTGERSKSTANSASPSATVLERFRSTSSSLPLFDGLTSSTSVSTALSSISLHTRTLLTQLRTKLSHLSSQYNMHTGYTAIEELKHRIGTLETSLEAARTLASTAKKTYLMAVQERSASQRETNDLLSRKNSWSETDLSRYTELLRKEHALSRHESEAEKELERSEAEVQASFDQLMKAVLVRYHEEQVWSDRMRGMSTYASLVVAGLNAFLFILAILLVEPYKRKKLAETFEKRLVAAEHESRRLILDSVDGFRSELSVVLAGKPAKPVNEVETEVPSLIPPVAEHQVTQVPPVVEPETPPTATLKQRHVRQDEERLVFASTVGVVVGAALSLFISACWA